jgi:hypothetical protein
MPSAARGALWRRVRLRGPRSRGGPQRPSTYEPIRLFESDGQLFTLDNRRLLVFSEAGLDVPYVMATDAEVLTETTGDFSKFTTTVAQGFGQFISVRGCQ